MNEFNFFFDNWVSITKKVQIEDKLKKKKNVQEKILILFATKISNVISSPVTCSKLTKCAEHTQVSAVLLLAGRF